MLRVNHCFRNCSTHSRDFSVVSGKSPSNDTAAGAAGVSATSSLVVEAADSFEAVGAPPFKYASTSSFVIRPFLPDPETALMLTPFHVRITY